MSTETGGINSQTIEGMKGLGLQSNPNGIPMAPFVEDVEKHLGGPDEAVEPTLLKFKEAMSKYKMMELNTSARRRGLEDKIPDIKKTLEMVKILKEKNAASEPLQTSFSLSDTLYSAATIPPTSTVNLWLGANVMLSYPLDEAITLLETKLAGAKKSLENFKMDLEFLRDQITTMEVNTARVHNWDVGRRREKRLEHEAAQK